MNDTPQAYVIDGRPRLIAIGFAADDALLQLARREPGLRLVALPDTRGLGHEGQGGTRVQSSDLALLSAARLGRLLLRSISLLRAIAPACRIAVADAAGPAAVAAMACGADLCIASSVSAREFGAVVQLLLDPPRPGRGATLAPLEPPGEPGPADPATACAPPGDPGFAPILREAGQAGFVAPGAAPIPAPLAIWHLSRERGALTTPQGLPFWLTPKEVMLMVGLALGTDQVITREHWLSASLPTDGESTEALRALRSMELAAVVSRLKRKVAVRTGVELPVRTVRGVGYQFMAELVIDRAPEASSVQPAAAASSEALDTAGS
ncbi:MAG: helix-turn-helix domain-containing protein [Bordetella sp.]|nr:helix-turn-helix domain-containing protein [Bordetella sp.]